MWEEIESYEELGLTLMAGWVERLWDLWSAFVVIQGQ